MQIGWYGGGYALTREWGRAWKMRCTNYHVRTLRRNDKRGVNRWWRRLVKQRVRAGDEDPFRRPSNLRATGWDVI
jgi:hypothetical protein